jgi:hypothetical protein
MAKIIKVIPCPVNDVKSKLNLTDTATSHYPEWRVLPEGGTQKGQPAPCPSPERHQGHQEEEEGREEGFVHQGHDKIFIATIYIVSQG